MKHNIIALFFLSTLLISCKKSTDTPAAVTKPRVGTTWTYQLDTYGAGGTTFISSNVVLKVSNEQIIGSDTWLNVTDSTGATIYLFKQKTDGLYHYASGAANLLCKDPAAVGEIYTAFHNGANTTFTVKETNITIGGSPFPDFVVNRYEGLQAGLLKDMIWYNKDAWIVRKETYEKNMSGVNNIKYRWRLLKISY